MRGSSAFKQICYWALVLALFAVRSADAHMHLCLDGQEQRASLHVADGGVHHTDPAGLRQTHNDKDVKFVGDGIFKKGDSADLWVLSTVWSIVDFVPQYGMEPPQYAATTPAFSSLSHLRPPLRGPPR